MERVTEWQVGSEQNPYHQYELSARSHETSGEIRGFRTRKKVVFEWMGIKDTEFLYYGCLNIFGLISLSISLQRLPRKGSGDSKEKEREPSA